MKYIYIYVYISQIYYDISNIWMEQIPHQKYVPVNSWIPTFLALMELLRAWATNTSDWFSILRGSVNGKIEWNQPSKIPNRFRRWYGIPLSPKQNHGGTWWNPENASNRQSGGIQSTCFLILLVMDSKNLHTVLLGIWIWQAHNLHLSGIWMLVQMIQDDTSTSRNHQICEWLKRKLMSNELE